MISMKYTCTIPCFDLEQTALSGQCFRLMPGKEPGLWSVISQGKLLSIRQNDSQFTFECEEGSLEYWLSYFDVSTDYQAMIDSIDPDDTYLLSAAKAGAGIRILRQDPWEMIITFVISQQKTIPAIRSLVEALCRNYGTHMERTLNASSKLSEAGPSPFAFPAPEQLSRASLDDLLALKLGYRAKSARTHWKEA
jgi:N-glycosylase/DNA lyase